MIGYPELLIRNYSKQYHQGLGDDIIIVAIVFNIIQHKIRHKKSYVKL